MSMRYASKSDGNQSQIVDELRKLGYDVDIVSREKGLYDVVVSGVPRWARRAVSVRVEIKANSKAGLSPAEAEYWDKQRHTECLIKATCTGDILTWFGAI